MKERLIKLLSDPHKAEKLRKMGIGVLSNENDYNEAIIADFLLANGVIAPPCKIGETVYCILFGKVQEGTIDEISITKENTYIGVKYKSGIRFLYYENSIEKDLFFDRAKAEKALANYNEYAHSAVTAALAVPENNRNKEQRNVKRVI